MSFFSIYIAESEIDSGEPGMLKDRTLCWIDGNYNFLDIDKSGHYWVDKFAITQSELSELQTKWTTKARVQEILQGIVKTSTRQ